MTSCNYPTTIAELTTPCFLVDLTRAKQNASRMLDRCEKLGIHLRPHMKTHKTVELGILQTGGSKRRIVVSTVKEAEFYADNGFDDIVYGCPITAHSLPRFKKLAASHEFHFLFDSPEGLDALVGSPLGEKKAWSVLLSVDTGNNREGVPWNSDDAIKLVKKAVASNNIHFQGLYTHEGHSYTCRDQDELRQCAHETVKKMISLRDRLQKEGIECSTVGVGSTPSCADPPESFSSLTELHPGNYIFYDYKQQSSRVCQFDDIACRVVTRVVSHGPSRDHFLVDCGFLALGHDGIAKQDQLPFGFCVFQNEPNLRMVSVTQELGKVKVIDGELDFQKYPIGKMLFIYPYHSCATAAMHSVYYVHDGDAVVGTYAPTRGW